MDKVLFIDAHNAMWRANVSFGVDKGAHDLCLDCDDLRYLHHQNRAHCKCGADWIDNSCEEDWVLVFNFFRNLRPIIELFSPDKCFFVLEGHPQFRYDLFADYKANRIIKRAAKQNDMDKFHKHKDTIIKLIKYLPITICRASNYEADDVIASLCENLKDEHLTVLSNDSDYIQLLQRGYSNIHIFNPIKKEFMQAPPYPYVAWKCLGGDKADNIPSLLTPKKAVNCVTNPQLFDKFMSVEENRANFSINRQLIEFRSVPEDEIMLVEGSRNFPALREEFDKMSFDSIINEKSWDKYCKTFNCLKY
jgi:hypothetical protein